ncbi:tyrosine-type recombinase/integrase [Candidatus Pseudothioglobus singularis]|nr:tyrosine-type recombinase/integrase [Candidatus Pseudothioglobus singularis]
MLTDAKLKNLKPKDKLYRVADSHGLVIEVTPTGSKLWRHRYRFNKRATMMPLGRYPLVSLLDARQARDNNKQLISQGINPIRAKVDIDDSKPTFQEMFDKWIANKKDECTSRYIKSTSQRANNYLIPKLGNLPIEDIRSPDMRNLLLKIQDTGKLDMLVKVKGIANSVFKYSVGMGVIEVNPVRDLPNEIFKKKPIKHYPTVTEPKAIGQLLSKLDQYNGSYEVNNALKLAPYLFLRPSELTGFLWDEVDLEDKLIRIHADRMKMNRTHLVPMSKQVLAIFQNLHKHNTGSSYVFPAPRDNNKPITPDSLRIALRRLGIEKDTFTTHSFRSMASTRLNELSYRSDVIEVQLAHVESNKIRGAYNHAQYLPERVKLMQDWSNYLDKLQNKTTVSPSELQQSLF